MECVPVIIPTLNRCEHLKRCIDSLRNNTYAKDTALYISLDYPPSAKYEAGYRDVKEYLDNGIDGFAEVVIYQQEKNLGPYANIEFLTEKVYEKYDSYILTEDDNEFSPCFLEFMSKGIEKYRDDEDVFAICCSAAPLKGYDNKSELVKILYFSAHGYATWKDKDNLFKETVNRSYIEDVASSKSKLKKMRKTDYRTVMYLASTLLRKEPIYQTKDGSIPYIDTSRRIYSCAEQKYIVASAFPMVRNWGFDGSGENCVVEDDFMHTRPIREDKLFDITDMEPCLCRVNSHWSIKNYILLTSARMRIWLWRIISKHKLHE